MGNRIPKAGTDPAISRDPRVDPPVAIPTAAPLEPSPPSPAGDDGAWFHSGGNCARWLKVKRRQAARAHRFPALRLLNGWGGNRGSEAPMLISDVVGTKGTNVVKIRTTDTVLSAVQRLSQHRIGALVVENEWMNLVGIFSERDLVNAVARHGAEALAYQVQQLMSSPIV